MAAKKEIKPAAEPAKLKAGSTDTKKSTTTAVTKKTDSAGTAAKKKTTTKKEQVNLTPKSSRVIHQFIPYIIIVAAIFIAACLLLSNVPGSVGDVGRVISRLLFGLFGWPAYFIPIILLNLAIYWRKYVDMDMVGWKITLSVAALCLIGALVHVFSVNSEFTWADWGNSIFGTNGARSNWARGVEKHGGGFLGGFFGGFFRCATGPIGSPIILIAVIAVCVMFMFSVTPRYVWQEIRIKWLDHAEKQQQKREELAAREAEREKEIRQKQKAAAKKKREAEQKRAEAERMAAEQKRAREEDEALLRKKKKADALAAARAAAQTDPMTDSPVTHKEQPASANEGVIILPGMMPSADAQKAAPAAPAAPDLPPTPASAPDPSETAQGTNDPGSLLASIFDDAAFRDGSAVPPKKKPRSAHTEVPLTSGDDAPVKKAPADPTASASPSASGAIPLTEIVNDGTGILTDRAGEAPEAAAPETEAEPEPEPYVFPFPELLHEIVNPGESDITAELNSNAQKLMNKLGAFNVRIQKIEYSRGPTITRYELYPEASTRVKSISNLADDIALELATSVRIEAPIPNKQAVGIEVPNRNRATVFMRELIESEKFCGMKSKLAACLGKDVGGNMVFIDIAKTPHLLIAGTTGSGKSVCINCIILSLLYKARPDEVQFIMIDPKKIEMVMYNDLPHMKVPVVTDVKKAAGALNAAVNEMEHRYELFEEVHARDIDSYNRLMSATEPDFTPLPKIVIIIDELADLMMTGPAEVEASIARLAQKARAAGLHLIIGTQRPSVNVITGVIKANIPTRIAFMVASQTDSRVIIDQQGAEKLIGKGDMLYSASDNPKPVRVQGAFVADDEVESVTNFIKERNAEHGEYDNEFMEEIEREAERLNDKKGSASEDEGEGAYMFSQPADELFAKALGYAVENGTVATSFLQRKLSVGFGRAGKIIDRMEALGFVSPANGTKPRNVLLTAAQLAEMKMNGDPRVDGNFNE